MDRWMAWFGELGAAVVDMGAPFGAAATGYAVIEAANLHDTVVMAKGCPA
jgi:hypothetical protein